MGEAMKKALLLILVFLVLIGDVFALTAALGTARGIVRVDVEEGQTVTLDRTLKVINKNDVNVKVGLEVSGDFVGRMDLEETELLLSPGEEKEVRYLVRINQPGTYQGKIRAGFAREDGQGAGVGTIYTLIVLAEGPGEEFVSETQPAENQDNTNTEDITDEDNEITGDVVDDNTDDSGDGVNVAFGNTKPGVQKQTNTDATVLIAVLVVGVIIILGVFLYLRRVLK